MSIFISIKDHVSHLAQPTVFRVVLWPGFLQHLLLSICHHCIMFLPLSYLKEHFQRSIFMYQMFHCSKFTLGSSLELAATTPCDYLIQICRISKEVVSSCSPVCDMRYAICTGALRCKTMSTSLNKCNTAGEHQAFAVSYLRVQWMQSWVETRVHKWEITNNASVYAFHSTLHFLPLSLCIIVIITQKFPKKLS